MGFTDKRTDLVMQQFAPLHVPRRVVVHASIAQLVARELRVGRSAWIGRIDHVILTDNGPFDATTRSTPLIPQMCSQWTHPIVSGRPSRDNDEQLRHPEIR